MKRFFLELLVHFEHLIGNLEFLSVINTISCLFKMCLLSIFLYRIRTNPVTSSIKKRSFLLIFISLLCAILCDFTWLVKLYSLIRHITCDYRYVLLTIRLAWIAVTINFHSLALFLEQMCDAHYRTPIRHYLLFIISGGFVLFFLHAIIFNFHCLSSSERPTLELLVQKISLSYGLFILVLPSFCRAWHRVRTKQLPIILKKQANIFMWGLVAPYWIGELIQGNPFEMLHPAFVTRSYALSGMSTLLFTVMLYFSAKKIMGFRFLNINKHVYVPSLHRFAFINTFRGVIGQFGQATSLHELNNIVQHFFKETFDITLEKSWLHLLFKHDVTPTTQHDERIRTMVTAFLSQPSIPRDSSGGELLVFNEIEFSQFHEPDSYKTELLNFLKSINADIVLPIYDDKKHLFASIIIERHARPQEIYTYTEQDEIIVFGKYLYNVITLLRNRKIDILLEQKHAIEHELYQKKQEIAQYKESIRSFIRATPHKYIGIIFYKNRTFIRANQTAHELLPFDINNHEGEQITRQLKKIVSHVETYKTMHTQTIQTNQNNSLIIFASPHLEQNMVIITVSHPDISDILREQTDILHSNNELDYLLYLSTTKLGALINELIPFNDSLFLNFKVDLLKLSLSKKALLLSMPDEDMMPVVELLHHISGKTLLRVIEIKETTDQSELAVTLFGINPLLARTNFEPALLEQLDNNGTLFLKNIDLASSEIQEHLVEFIKTGHYRTIKGSHTKASNVRIICSTHQPVSMLTKGYFNTALYEEFTKTSLSLPSLLTLPEQTVHELADSISRQTISTSNLGPLLTLNKREKTTLTAYRPASLHELRRRIHSLISQKAKQHEPENRTTVISCFLDTSDPELVMASKLGKHALKDPHLMSMLWQKLDGNQNKIAMLLGVNRSSVNRRCREYNLH